MEKKKYFILSKSAAVNILTALSVVILFIVSAYHLQAQSETCSFNISMDNPNSHYYHVNMIYSGASSPVVNFKIPSWTPGYSSFFFFLP